MVLQHLVRADQRNRAVNSAAAVRNLDRLNVAVDVGADLGVDHAPLVYRVVVIDHQTGAEVGLEVLHRLGQAERALSDRYHALLAKLGLEAVEQAIVNVPRVIADIANVQIVLVAQLNKPVEHNLLVHLVARHGTHQAALDPQAIRHAVALTAVAGSRIGIKHALRQPVHTPAVDLRVARPLTDSRCRRKVDAVCRIHAADGVVKRDIVRFRIRALRPGQPACRSVFFEIEILDQHGRQEGRVCVRLFDHAPQVVYFLDGAKSGIGLDPHFLAAVLVPLVQLVDPCQERVIVNRAVNHTGGILVLGVKNALAHKAVGRDGEQQRLLTR